MLVIWKVFIWHKKWRLLLLGICVGIILCLASLIGFLEKSVDEQLVLRELGAIPGFSLVFNHPLTGKELDEIGKQLVKLMPIEHLRKGFKISNRVSFRWNKGGETVETSVDITRIGIDLNEDIKLILQSANSKVEAPCLKMDPVKGFYIQDAYVRGLGKKIRVISAMIGKNRVYKATLDLPAELRPGSLGIKGKQCIRYSFPKPKKFPLSRDEERAYREVREKYYSRISHALSLPLGAKMWRTFHKDTRKNLFRLYDLKRVPAAAIPSLQLWDDICGASYQKRARYKYFTITEKYDGKVIRCNLEFWGYYLTRYRTEVNGYVIMCNHDWLVDYLGLPENTFNFMDIEVPFKEADKTALRKLRQALIKMGMGVEEFKIIPWWEMANKRSVKLLTRIRANLSWFKWAVICISLFVFWQIVGRFLLDILGDWNLFRILGARKGSILWISMAHIIIYGGLGVFLAFATCRLLDALVISRFVHVTFYESSEGLMLSGMLMLWIPLLAVIGSIHTVVLACKRGKA